MQVLCLLTELTYTSRYKQKQVDLSVPFRTSGLIPGAKLELVQRSNTPSAVQVALQIPQPEARNIPGGRLIRKFPSDLSLWQVLRQFESGDASAGHNINITARGVARVGQGAGAHSGQLYYETPVLNIMGREFSTFVDFQKTLFQLGYNSGNVLVRLAYKTTDQTFYEAVEEISRVFKESQREREADSRPAATSRDEPAETTAQPDASPDTPMADSEAEPPQQAAEASSVSEPQESQPGGLGPEPAGGDADMYKPVSVYLAPTSATPAAALAPVDDSDFIPTVAHAKLHQARLQKSSRNKRLLSDRELEEKAAAEAAKIAAIKSVRVKVRFPDNTSSEWVVGPSETGAFLYEAVRHVMASPDQPFRLAVPPGKTIVRDRGDKPEDNLVRGYKFSGRVLLNLLWNDSVPADVRSRPFLRASVASQGQPIKVPEVPQVEEEEPAAPEPKEEKKKSTGGEKKVPKWFKMGKK